MNQPEHQADLDIERLVRGGLERGAETIDPRALFNRIEQSLAASAASLSVQSPEARRRLVLRSAWKWAGGAAAAAAIVIGFAVLMHERTALAKGETVVREARRAHLLPIDRCYLVEVRRESSLVAELSPAGTQVRQTRLWTRGDRFWVESVRPEQRWAWGRDEENRFWIAFGPHTAVRMEAGEVPMWLNVYCDLHSLNFEKWLGEVLARFELTREAKPGDADSSTIVVRAKAKARPAVAQYPTISSAELEIDAQTRVVRRMVVRRVSNGEPFATVTYTLAETDALDPADYRLEGHLSEPSEIYTRENNPERRRELLNRWFGPRSGRRFPMLEQAKDTGGARSVPATNEQAKDADGTRSVPATKEQVK
jgi:hypothetical protein